jgi:hypothetical protein
MPKAFGTGWLVNMTDRTAAERMARKRERDRAKGIIEIIVRVPKEAADEVRKLAAERLAEREDG